MGDLPGPEKPLDWGSLLKLEQSSKTAARPMYTPIRVRPRHRIAVMLHESGLRPKEIAKMLGYTEARLSVILNSHNNELQTIRTGFATQVAENCQDVMTRLKLHAHEMVDIMLHHARDRTKGELSRLAAKDILDRAGFSPIKKQFTIEGKLPAEDLKRAMDKIDEANEVVLKSTDWRVKSA